MTYVDDMAAPYRGMCMFHLLADSTEELLAVAEKLGLKAAGIQHAGTPKEHFDISLSKKKMALQYGAKAITWREAGKIVAARRGALLSLRKDMP